MSEVKMMMHSSFLSGKSMGLAFLLIMSVAFLPAMAAGTGSGPSVWEIETVDNAIGDNTTALQPSLVWGKDGIPQI
ncbi:MAG: hypothetical protein Q8R70_10370, partial [Methanoregula sp.]|nr:hypothetical protein [Methanoregula sp.]